MKIQFSIAEVASSAKLSRQSRLHGKHVRLALCLISGLVPLISCPFVFSDAIAAETKTEEYVRPIRRIDQVVSASFKPESAFVLVQLSSGEVKRYPAIFVPLREGNESGQFLLGSEVPEFAGESESLFFTFFLKGSDGSFAATAVKGWNREAIESNSLSSEALEEQVTKLRSEQRGLFNSTVSAESELKALRLKASKIAGVDEIIDIKMDLARLKGVGEQGAAEQDRLRRLIVVGRQVQDPADINHLRGDLTLQLRDTAQKTSMASRLTSRRKAVAKVTLERRLALVKEMEGYDSKALAQEVLRLREQRKMLESRVKSRSGEPEEDL